MAKKLKQQILFETLKKFKVSVKDYLGIYMMYTGVADQKMIDNVKEIYKENDKLNQRALNILNQLDSLFAANKKIKEEELLGPDYIKKIDEFNKIFPTGSLPSGSRARAQIPILKKKFIRFFSEYDFTWETVLKAADIYVTEFEEKGYDRMRTSAHFIIKKVGEEEYCDLAEYCERALDSSYEVKPNKFVTRVF
jgi:hypothetical protein